MNSKRFSLLVLLAVSLLSLPLSLSAQSPCPQMISYMMVQCHEGGCPRGSYVTTLYTGENCTPKHTTSDMESPALKALYFPIKSLSSTQPPGGIYRIEFEKRCLADLIDNVQRYPLGNALLYKTELPAEPSGVTSFAIAVKIPEGEQHQPPPVEEVRKLGPLEACKFFAQISIKDGGIFDYYTELLVMNW
jgi:hypothetical protein